MMERYSGDFLAAVDGLRGLLGCVGRVWPVSVEQASVCAEYADGTTHARRSRGGCRVSASATASRASGSSPPCGCTRTTAEAIAQFDAAVIGPGSFYTSLMPIFLVQGAAEAIAKVQRSRDPRGEPADGGARHGGLHRRRRRGARWARRSAGPIDVAIVNTARPSRVHARALRARAQGAAGSRALPPSCELVEGDFWCGEIARHDRRRLAQAVWAVLARRLL